MITLIVAMGMPAGCANQKRNRSVESGGREISLEVLLAARLNDLLKEPSTSGD